MTKKPGRKLLTVLCLLTALTGMTAAASETEEQWRIYHEEYNSIYAYTGSTDSDTLELPTQVDGMPVYRVENMIFENGAETLQKIIIPEGYIALGNMALYSANAMTSVQLPESLQAIGAKAFWISKIKSVDIPARVGYIGTEAFASSTLSSITFHGAVPIMGERVFEYSDLATAYVPDDLIEDYRAVLPEGIEIVGNGSAAQVYTYDPDEEAFDFDPASGTIWGYTGESPIMKVPASIQGTAVTAIGEQAFYKNDAILYAELPEGVTEIGKEAFQWTPASQIVLPSTLKTIGDGAFNGYSHGGETLSLPEGLESIGKDAFQGLSAESLYLPSTILSIGSGAFANTALNYMAIDSYEVPDIAQDAFAGYTLYNLRDLDLPWDISRQQWEAYKAVFETMGFDDLTVWRNNPVSGGVCDLIGFNNGGIYEDGYLTSYEGDLESVSVYPSGNNQEVVGLGPDVFAGNKTIRKFYPHHCDYFTTIGDRAFADSTLEYIEMFDSITTIGSGAFSNCTNMTELVLPPYLTEIAADALSGCSSLTFVDIQCDASILPEGLFADCSSLETVHVSSGSIANGLFKNLPLTEATLDAGVSAIGEEAFAGTQLQQIVIPAVETVAASAVRDIPDITVSADMTDEVLAKLNADLPERWYDPVVREGEERRFKTMPFAATAEEAFEFDSETGTILTYTGDAIDVVIPRTIGGVTVTAIKGDAFENCRDYTDTEITTNRTQWVHLRSVVIPETVTSLEDGTFEYCQQLECVICYGPLETTGRSTFMGCSSLKNVVFVNGLLKIDNYCFDTTRALEKVYYGTAAEVIGNGAFNGSGITSMVVDASEVTITAFWNCPNLETLHFTGRVETMSEGMVQNCPKLSFICFEQPEIGEIEYGLVAEAAPEITLQVPESFDMSGADVFSQRVIAYSANPSAVSVTAGSCDREEVNCPDVEEMMRDYGIL